MTGPFPIPLNAIRAIEIVARRGALGPAADELGVTVGAVSQHIRRAEARLGVELFERTPSGLVPLPALTAVLPQLSSGFAALADATAGLVPADSGVLTVSVASVFASRWLVWRLAKFAARYPEIDLRLSVNGAVIDLNRPDIDCGIRFGRGHWAGAVSTPIGGFSYQPVCAPSVAARLKGPADLVNVPIIHDASTMISWPDWLAHAGVPGLVLRGPEFSDSSLAFDAAIAEQGVLLAVDMMSADAVSDGRLVRPFDLPFDAGDLGYWLAHGEGRRPPRKLDLFRQWLAIEGPDSVDGYLNQQRR